MVKFLFKKKGFALTQVLLALAIGAVVSVGVVTYYSHVQKDQDSKLVADNIVNNSENSFQEAQIHGTNTNQQLVVGGSNVVIASGLATITNISNGQCNRLSSNLESKGVVTATCTGDVATNVVTFIPKNFAASSKNNLGFVGGVADPGATNTVNAPNLTGVFVAGGTGVAAGSTKTFSPISSGPTLPNPGVINGNNGALGGGGSAAPSGGSAPISVTGNSSLACAYYLTQPSYQTTSLGTRTTSCPSGYISTANQTGTRTWACASPNSATLPTSTDTWTGGACTALCVPAASQTQTLGCPSGQTGSIAQQRNSSCPAQTGSPVWGAWYNTSDTCVTPAAPPTNWAKIYSVNFVYAGGVDSNGHNDYELYQIDLDPNIYSAGLTNVKEDIDLAPPYGATQGCMDLVYSYIPTSSDAQEIAICATIQAELFHYFQSPTVNYSATYIITACNPNYPGSVCGLQMNEGSVLDPETSGIGTSITIGGPQN